MKAFLQKIDDKINSLLNAHFLAEKKAYFWRDFLIFCNYNYYILKKQENEEKNEKIKSLLKVCKNTEILSMNKILVI